MKYGRKGFVVAWATMIALAAAVLVVSCGQESPTAVNNGAGELEAIIAVELAKLAPTGVEGAAKPEPDIYLIDSDQVEQRIDGDGAELKLRLDGERIFFLVPQDALYLRDHEKSVEVRIRGEKWNVGSGAVFYYDCFPEGVVFAEPIILVQPLASSDGELERLYFKDPEIGWKVEDEEQVSSGEARFDIHHFSKYAISD